MMPQTLIDQQHPDLYDPLKLRYEKNWTISILAKKLKVSESAVKQWSSRKKQPGIQSQFLAYLYHSGALS